MKFSILACVLSVASVVFADNGVAEEAPVERQLVVDPNFVPTAEKPFNIHITSNIAFKEKDSIIEDIYNGETIQLTYELTSYEPELIKVLGVGGELLNPITGEVAANITAAKIGPIEIQNNETTTFNQKVGIQLTPGSYSLSPAIYVVYDEQFMMLTTSNKIINVKDEKVSIFNLKLIFAELVLGGTVFAIVYFLYQSFAATYLSGILPASMLPVNKKQAARAAKKEKSASVSASASASDLEQWLPDTHKTIARKSKKKA